RVSEVRLQSHRDAPERPVTEPRKWRRERIDLVIQRFAGEGRARREEVLDAAADVEPGFGVRSFQPRLLEPEAVHPDAGGDVRVYGAALPVVHDVAVEIERLDRAAEALADDVPPRTAQL